MCLGVSPNSGHRAQHRGGQHERVSAVPEQDFAPGVHHDGQVERNQRAGPGPHKRVGQGTEWCACRITMLAGWNGCRCGVVCGSCSLARLFLGRLADDSFPGGVGAAGAVPQRVPERALRDHPCDAFGGLIESCTGSHLFVGLVVGTIGMLQQESERSAATLCRLTPQFVAWQAGPEQAAPIRQCAKLELWTCRYRVVSKGDGSDVSILDSPQAGREALSAGLRRCNLQLPACLPANWAVVCGWREQAS